MYFLGSIFLHMKARKLWQNLPKFPKISQNFPKFLKISQNFSTWKFFPHKYNLWYLLQIWALSKRSNSSLICRRRRTNFKKTCHGATSRRRQLFRLAAAPSFWTLGRNFFKRRWGGQSPIYTRLCLKDLEHTSRALFVNFKSILCQSYANFMPKGLYKMGYFSTSVWHLWTMFKNAILVNRGTPYCGTRQQSINY